MLLNFVLHRQCSWGSLLPTPQWRLPFWSLPLTTQAVRLWEWKELFLQKMGVLHAVQGHSGTGRLGAGTSGTTVTSLASQPCIQDIMPVCFRTALDLPKCGGRAAEDWGFGIAFSWRSSNKKHHHHNLPHLLQRTWGNRWHCPSGEAQALPGPPIWSGPLNNTGKSHKGWIQAAWGQLPYAAKENLKLQMFLKKSAILEHVHLAHNTAVLSPTVSLWKKCKSIAARPALTLLLSHSISSSRRIGLPLLVCGL